MPTKYIFFLVLILGLAGCQNKSKTDDYVSDSLKQVASPQQPRAATQHQSSKSTTSPAPRAQTIDSINTPGSVPPIGIKVDRDQIIIDTAQTKKFLESLTKKLDNNFKQVAQDLKKNKINSPNETGIIITKDRIEVDLNKTQKFMDKWIRSMETIGKQLDNVSKELDKSFGH